MLSKILDRSLFSIGIAKLSDILELRHEVLRPNQSIENGRFVGDHFPSTKHFAMYFMNSSGQEKNIACCTFMPWERNEIHGWKLRGMAVHADFRKSGSGKKLLSYAESVMLSASPATRLFCCDSRVNTIKFYEKMGYIVVSTEFEIEDLGPHVTMMKVL